LSQLLTCPCAALRDSLTDGRLDGSGTIDCLAAPYTAASVNHDPRISTQVSVQRVPVVVSSGSIDSVDDVVQLNEMMAH